MICRVCHRRPSDYDDRALCGVCADRRDQATENRGPMAAGWTRQMVADANAKFEARAKR